MPDLPAPQGDPAGTESAVTSQLDAALYVVEFTEPYTTDAGHTYSRNRAEQILCADLYRAVEVFAAKHPDGTPHVIRKVGVARSVLIDADLTAQADPGRRDG